MFPLDLGNMYALDEIADDLAGFRAAVLTGAPYRPLYVKIKVVWGCNLRCRGCNHWRETKGAALSLAHLQTVTDELAGMGCRKIHLSGGEPTLRPDLEVLIGHIARLGIRPTLTTNATLITRERARALADAGIKGANISIDSPDPAVHDRMRGMAGAWKHTIKGTRFLRRRLKHGHLRINAVISRFNYASLADLPDLAADLGADYLNLIPLDENTGDVRRLNKAQILDYNARIAPRIAERSLALGLMQHAHQAYPYGVTSGEIELAKAGDYARGQYNAHPCYAPWTHALIDHQGKVNVCCVLRTTPIMGEIGEQTFAQVWEGPAYAALRHRSHQPLFDACRRCDDFLAENRALYDLIQLRSENTSPTSVSESSNALAAENAARSAALNVRAI
jgi:MoaA/NifB/PqqE/SkfB family radical SAM enzyme